MLGDVSVLDDEFPSVLRVLTAVAAAHAPTLAAWVGASVASLSGGGAPPRLGRCSAPPAAVEGSARAAVARLSRR